MWQRPFQRHFVTRRLGLAMFNPHIKFEMSTITRNEETKGNASEPTVHTDSASARLPPCPPRILVGHCWHSHCCVDTAPVHLLTTSQQCHY